MWKCHKCGKPVYFAERKQSLGYNWHPECLRCEECGKRLNPGQHAEHKGVPYCHVPCYGALFGPQLFGHGTRVESHKSFGVQKDSPKIGNGPSLPRSHLESKLKVYNQFFEGKSGEIRSREVNGRLILEGSLRIYWGVQGVIHLKENDDQRTVVTVRKRNSCRMSTSTDNDSDDEIQNISRDTSYNDISMCSDTTSLDISDISKSDTGIESGLDSTDTSTAENSPSTPPPEMLPKSVTLPSKLDVKNLEWDELDELLQVERKFDESEKLYQTMPVPLPSQSSTETSSSTQSNDSSTKTESYPDESSDKTVDSEKLENPRENGSAIDELSPLKKSISKDDSWLANSNHLNRSMSGPDCLGRLRDPQSPEFDRASIASTDISTMSEALGDVVIRRAPKTGSTAIRRRPGKRLSRSKVKRRCSINGHFYDRETSFFTPPHGSQTSVWVTSLVNTQEVINLMLDKYKVDSDGSNFALFVVRDNGEQRRLKEEEYPLLARVLLGPHEDVAKLFLMDSHNTPEVIGRRNAHHYTDGLPVSTVNDLPTPQGSWQTHYDAKQRKYNAQLAAGIGILIGTIVVGKAAGFLEFHNDYPERPADIASYK
ncbi:LIM and/or RA domain containing protein [Asbolus verrucosus]|uniref:LIM and/or RA domain containing protein n=1 Tax=Asbolus verrucosus TaxID=1661398 RepID=A0A482W8B1_ASBVE|nr:LIM and/or RA domain containing protein [Asbolus verrucosus]